MNARQRRRRAEQERLSQLFVGHYVEGPLFPRGGPRVPPGGPLTTRRLHIVLAHFWLHAALDELSAERRARYLTRFIARSREHFLAAFPENLNMRLLERRLLDLAHEQLHALDDDEFDDQGELDAARAAAFMVFESSRILAETPHARLVQAHKLISRDLRQRSRAT